LPVSPPVSLVAELPPLVVVELAPAPMLPPAPAPADELAPAPLRLAPPALPGVGSAAPICPAAVPGPARPALSVSAGDPCAAYAPATAADMAPAISAIMSFLITCLPKIELKTATPLLRAAQGAAAIVMPMSSPRIAGENRGYELP
jgi:hypothetical protein